jgi:peroxiredoxin
MQMPGAFLIDTDGHIRYSCYAKDASGHPQVNTLPALKNMFT